MTEPRANPPARSMRRRLTVSVLLALLIFLLVDAAVVYQTTLTGINTAFDRTLLAAAKAIGDTVRHENGRITADLPYSSLDAFEAITRGRIAYRVSGLDGEVVAGTENIEPFTGEYSTRNQFPALVEFYEAQLDGEDVRVAALLQPVYVDGGYRMLSVQVAETLETRRAAAQAAVIQVLRWQTALVLLLALLVWYLVDVGLEPLASLGRQLRERNPASLTPIATSATTELKPLVASLNELISRLRGLLDTRERFVRDASHQLRTPLAVLKTQVQNARAVAETPEILSEIEASVDRATRVANQMLSLARVAASSDAAATAPVNRIDVVALCREIVVELSPLIARKEIEFALEGEEPVTWRLANDWMLRELIRNLLSNAIKYTPEGGQVGINVTTDVARRISIEVWDSGPGMSTERLAAPFQPFVTSGVGGGAGLGLVICRDISLQLNATLDIANRTDETGRVIGLRVLFATG
jgi:two-component system sensor histidine kinase TctE